MRIVKFAKIDFIRCRSNLFLLLFPIFAQLLMFLNNNDSSMFTYTYSLFAAVIFSTLPFSLEQKSNNGFLNMLPSRRGESILGHFLCSLTALLACNLVFFLSVAAAHLIRPSIWFDYVVLYPLLSGIALLIIGLESILLSLFRYNNAQMQKIICVTPAFVFLFGSLSIVEKLPQLVARFIAWITLGKSVLLTLFCVLLYLVLGMICTIIGSRRETR